MDEQATTWQSQLTSTQIDQYLYSLSLFTSKIEFSYGSGRNEQWHCKIVLCKGVVIERNSTWLPDLLRSVERAMRENGIVVAQDFLHEDWQKKQNLREADAQIAKAQTILADDKSIPFFKPQPTGPSNLQEQHDEFLRTLTEAGQSQKVNAANQASKSCSYGSPEWQKAYESMGGA